MSNIVFLAERWPFAWRPTSPSPHNLVKNRYLLIRWRSMPPAQSQNSTVPLRNLKGGLELSAFPAGFGIPRPEGAKARGSFLDRRNPRVNRSSILFFVLASSIFAMLSSGEIANFVMRLNNSMDECPKHLGTFAEAIYRGRQKRRSGASSVVASGVSSARAPLLPSKCQ